MLRGVYIYSVVDEAVAVLLCVFEFKSSVDMWIWRGGTVDVHV